MLTVSLTHYLVLAAFLLCCGLYVMTTKRNAVGILIGAELVLNAAGLNMVAFSRYGIGGIDGQIGTLFVIVLAAAEAAIAIAILVNYYRVLATIDVDQADALKG
ncbi:MAG: NADH-quinone oxidoreductase subunit NuoK [Phycisphaerae bacterium]|jgi:NADH-quinone oxidoreductase subunit K|nr:NADH-quinone oxidoreductase subunit NuoK [Phycisphaerae bacterium]NLG43452.1 NADH-quinone oxidoreductase subunit NuoK [Phycisphaerae bacterium]HPC22961.1 NADH-quinone oxidoreductase subunit NuoK [Phycisphaerae bacterium]HRT42659.1 NADH-quinone oxidoreductase subunit NuoK [Phycisphaerae bacterium]